MARRILVIEDDEALALLLRDYLEADGFEAVLRRDGAQGLEAALAGGLDLAIVDLMLPGLDGFEVVRGVRAHSELPLLILSARRDEGDKIRGLGLGADDYVTKPFSPGELLARVKARLARHERLTRRAAPAGTADVSGLSGAGGLRDGPGWIRDGDFAFNPLLRAAELRGAELKLSGKEFELLALLVQNPRRVFSKDELYERLWGTEEFRDTGTVGVCVHRLREKIEDDPAHPLRLETVWGMGYRWSPAR